MKGTEWSIARNLAPSEAEPARRETCQESVRLLWSALATAVWEERNRSNDGVRDTLEQ
jgi:hypothetical protein